MLSLATFKAILFSKEFIAILQLSFYFVMFLFAIFIIWRLFRKPYHYEVPARDITKGHRWCVTDILNHTAYCSLCGNLIVDGLFCDSCGICVDHDCHKTADKTLYCKSLSGTGTSVKHHWIKGNMNASSSCEVCEEGCGLEAALADYRCCWCQRTVHTKCKAQLGQICDFGNFRAFIVPPYCIRLKLVGWKGRRHLVVKEVSLPSYTPWTPLIVIANRKSGNNDGELILSAFRGILNPAQVIDLNELPPESGLEWCNLIPDAACRILVAGGDGTINWVLTAIDRLKLDPPPPICVIPLGTGNDLSRVLGWGEGYSSGGDVDVKMILDQLKTARQVKLDRWKVRVTPHRHLAFRFLTQDYFMINYASIGVDALVALNFHKTRDSKYYFFSNRIFNKFLYLTYGTKDLLERECKDLHRKVSIWLDDQEQELPEVEAIIVLNIPSWGAGVRPWHMGPGGQLAQPQSYQDGLLEVIGVYSSFHIAQLQVGLSEPVRIGQAKEVKIILHERLPMQVDGEPWQQPPSTIMITLHNQASLLASGSELSM